MSVADRLSRIAVHPRNRAHRTGPGRGAVVICAVAAGYWPCARLQRAEASFLVPASLDPLSLPVTAWLWLALQSIGIALGLLAFARIVRPPGVVATIEPPGRAFEPVAIVGIFGLAVVLRTMWSDVVPPGLWSDPIWGLRAAAGAGRFLGPHEAVLLYPPEMGPTRLLVSGLLTDILRATLLLSGDRLTAYRLISVGPALLSVIATWLLARRLAGPRAGVAAGFLAACASWGLWQARWGWAQPMMTALTVLALERLVAGLRVPSRRALATGAFLAGLSCHIYLAGWLTGFAMTAWAAVELARLRQSRAALLVVLVFTLTVLPLAGPYLDQPGLVGGRVHTIVLRGSFTTVASDFAANAVDHVGQLFFVPDPNPRHGLPDGGRFGVVLLPLFVLGLVVAHRERLAARAEWRGLVAVGTVLVLGASLAMRDSSPNSYRTGALAPLALCVAGLGLAAVASDASRSALHRRLLAGLIATGVLATETERFARWGLPAEGNRAFLGDATATANFVAQVGAEHVELDRSALLEGIGPAYAVSFLSSRSDVLAVPPLLRTLPPGAGPEARTPGRWLVTQRRPTGPAKAVQIGFGPTSSPRLVALPPASSYPKSPP